jgi:LPXTG-motif cell wall-anchored protein
VGIWSEAPIVVGAAGVERLAATGTTAGWATGVGVALIALRATFVALQARSRRPAV